MTGKFFANEVDNIKRDIMTAYYTMKDQLDDAGVRVFVLAWTGNDKEGKSLCDGPPADSIWKDRLAEEKEEEDEGGP